MEAVSRTEYFTAETIDRRVHHRLCCPDRRRDHRPEGFLAYLNQFVKALSLLHSIPCPVRHGR